jgi:hypothetical protein
MTRNQQSVLRWLRSYCNASGFIKVSNSEIAEVFGWSQQYTQKILSSLVSAGYLEELQKGAGHRPTRYRVSASHNLFTSSHNQLPDRQQVQDKPKKSVAPFRLFTIPVRKPRESAQPNTRSYIQHIFDNVAVDVYKPVRTGNSPFKRFKSRWDRVEEWTGADFVCYFSLVYKVRFGEMPKLEWAKDIGAARVLRKRLGGDPIALKGYIQIAFYRCKRPPDGLHTFSYGRTYQDIKDMEVPEEVLDEYDDEYVFPWLKEQLLQRSRLAAQEYTRNLVRRGLGIYN